MPQVVSEILDVLLAVVGGHTKTVLGEFLHDPRARQHGCRYGNFGQLSTCEEPHCVQEPAFSIPVDGGDQGSGTDEDSSLPHVVRLSPASLLLLLHLE